MDAYWIFGGSCSGKKTFIRDAVANPSKYGLPEFVRDFWFYDGEISIEELVEYLTVTPTLIRWQWGRENMMYELIQNAPHINHHIIMCKVMPSVQVKWVIKREGELKWPERTLIRESEEVQYLVEQISINHGIQIRFIDTSSGVVFK